MAENLLPGRYAVGKASVDAGGTVITPKDATWTDNVWVDDLFFLPSQPLVPPQRIESVDPVTGAIALAYPWPGAAAVEEAYEVRFVGIIERSTAQSRKVLEQLGDVKAWYDIIVEDDAARLALESASNPLRSGYRVLVRLDGVIWMKKTSAFGDWEGPVEFKGDKGDKGWAPVFGVVSDGERRVLQLTAWVGGEGTAPAGVGKYVGAAGLVDDIAQAIDMRGEGFQWGSAYNPATAYAKGAVIRDNGSSWIALQATTGNAPPVLPTTSNAYWELLAAKGQDGEIDGVTPFWQSRILNDADAGAALTGLGFSAFIKSLVDDADAAAARTTLELVKQTSVVDATAGRILTAGAFGVGKSAVLVGPNLNDTRPSGKYYCNHPSNGPSGTTNGWLDVWDLDVDYAYHEFIDLAGVRYRRFRYAGAWGGWEPLQLVGSNANGRYYRFGNGFQICTQYHTCAATSLGSVAWTYPASFYEKAAAFLVMEQGDSTDPTLQGFSARYGQNGASATIITYKSPSTVTALAVAIGRWK